MTLYAIDQINKDESILPGVKLALDIQADCRTDTLALQKVSLWTFAAYEVVLKIEFLFQHCQKNREEKKCEFKRDNTYSKSWNVFQLGLNGSGCD